MNSLVSQPPSDTVSALRFGPAGQCENFLMSASWDGSLSCYQIDANCQSSLKSRLTSQTPILGASWHSDGTKIFAGSADRKAYGWDLHSNQCVKLATHTEPVKTVDWITGSNYSCLMTGSWDKTVRFWDLRSPDSIFKIDFPDKISCADTSGLLSVIGCTNGQYRCFNHAQEPQLVSSGQIPSCQLRCASIFRDSSNGHPTAFAVGSDRGTVYLKFLQTNSSNQDIEMKSHFKEVSARTYNTYPVHGLSFHPKRALLVSVGGDGSYVFKELCSTDLQRSSYANFPLTACNFHSNGQLLAYSTGYDWSKGHAQNPGPTANIFLHRNPIFQ